jgi:hypothetical protein
VLATMGAGDGISGAVVGAAPGPLAGVVVEEACGPAAGAGEDAEDCLGATGSGEPDGI